MKCNSNITLLSNNKCTENSFMTTSWTLRTLKISRNLNWKITECFQNALLKKHFWRPLTYFNIVVCLTMTCAKCWHNFVSKILLWNNLGDCCDDDDDSDNDDDDDNGDDDDDNGDDNDDNDFSIKEADGEAVSSNWMSVVPAWSNWLDVLHWCHQLRHMTHQLIKIIIFIYIVIN